MYTPIQLRPHINPFRLAGDIPYIDKTGISLDKSRIYMWCGPCVTCARKASFFSIYTFSYLVFMGKIGLISMQSQYHKLSKNVYFHYVHVCIISNTIFIWNIKVTEMV